MVVGWENIVVHYADIDYRGGNWDPTKKEMRQRVPNGDAMEVSQSAFLVPMNEAVMNMLRKS